MRIYCTPKRAITMVIFLAGTFWTYDSKCKECVRRKDKPEIWESWTWSTEMVMFLTVPVMIMVLNMLIISEIRKSRKIALNLQRILFKTTATTTMLLVVSCFLILTTLPVNIANALKNSFPPGRIHNNLLDINEDPIWRAHLIYYEARTIIYNVGLTHYVMNFYIYLVAGDKFRRDVLIMLHCKKSARNQSRIHTSSETIKMESFCSNDTF
ncbi:hypothetical protein ACJMK2_043095 [Sinanodonta woodiana]|uniref:G-protein coupled receptors family 1 profile domain-containing protein n=1 Tax=Sinanodonta woodiana TaxID=1069815 RepID=A0ABD3VZH2_SINWO